jgi:hypothetical protein
VKTESGLVCAKRNARKSKNCPSVKGGVWALVEALRAGRGHGLSAAAMEAKIVDVTLHTAPPKPVTHWTSRRLATRLQVSDATIVRVWRRHGLKPHGLASYTESPDPDFETKATDIIALYVASPTHAVVFR